MEQHRDIYGMSKKESSRTAQEIQALRAERQEERKRHVLPPQILFNAHRWLRDFGGVSSLVDLPPAEDEQQKQWLKAGLRAHENWLKQFSYDLGHLDDTRDAQTSFADADFDSWEKEAGVSFIPYLPSAALGLMMMGVAILSWQLGRRRALASSTEVLG